MVKNRLKEIRMREYMLNQTEFSKVLGRIYVSSPINIGDIICRNILNTGVDIISTRKIERH